MKMEPIEGSETSAIINQTPGNYPKGNVLYSIHGESLKSRILNLCCNWVDTIKAGRYAPACQRTVLPPHSLYSHTEMGGSVFLQHICRQLTDCVEL